MKNRLTVLLVVFAGMMFWWGSVARRGGSAMLKDLPAANAVPSPATPAETETAVFAGGCFWCTEAVFQRLAGVKSVTSGYAGGATEHPTYDDICTGRTGHAECLRVEFDPRQVSYADLLQVFWSTHNPTTPNQQGADVGTQYRSAIFFADDAQRQQAEAYRRKLDEAKAFSAPIVTEIVPLDRFHPAENYHQGYYNANRRQPYCQAVIAPKLDKLRAVFAAKLKPDAD